MTKIIERMTEVHGTKFKCDICGCNFITDEWWWADEEIRIKAVECPKCYESVEMLDDNFNIDYILFTVE